MQFRRFAENDINRALKNSPVVLLLGPRQVGKTTLVRKIAQEKGMSYVSLDDIRILASIKKDPLDFIKQIHGPVVIDEIQRAPELFLPIKQIVDEDRKQGMFLLTGSANPFVAPKIADSLAGRMQIIRLWPLSVGEILDTEEQFLTQIFGQQNKFSTQNTWSKQQYMQAFIQGGYPGLQGNKAERDIDDWCESYLSTLLQRDVQELARIEGLLELPNLLKLLATRITGMMNNAELSRSSGLATTTLNRYLVLLEALFLIYRQQSWAANLGKRLVKSSKNYFVDTAIAIYLLAINKDRLNREGQLMGSMLENFVSHEILKQLSWHEQRISCYYFRTQAGVEVDFVLENKLGQIVGIEVKASQTIQSDDFKGLRVLQESLGDKFLRGIVLYTGDLILPFGSNMLAVPASCLWMKNNFKTP